MTMPRWNYRHPGREQKDIVFDKYQLIRLRNICNNTNAEPDSFIFDVTTTADGYYNLHPDVQDKSLNPIDKPQMEKLLADFESTAANFSRQLDSMVNHDHPLWWLLSEAYNTEQIPGDGLINFHEFYFDKPRQFQQSLADLKIRVDAVQEYIQAANRGFNKLYPVKRNNSAKWRYSLAERLWLIFEKHGITPSADKSGKLAECLDIIFQALNKPVEKVHRYIKKSTP